MIGKEIRSGRVRRMMYVQSILPARAMISATESVGLTAIYRLVKLTFSQR